MDYILMGRQVRSARKRKGMTQQTLAQCVGISTSFLGHVERGSRIASLETAVNLCRTLEISTDDLLGVTGQNGEDRMRQACAYLEEVLSLLRDGL